MKQADIQNRFTYVYSVLNFIFYFYIFLLFAVIIIALVSWNYIGIQVDLFFSDPVNVVMLLCLVFFVGFYFLGVFALLYILRNLVFDFKQGNIFTHTNKKRVKWLFIGFSLLLSLLFLFLSGGIFVLFVLIFLWILYEIFLVSFDYKLENDVLKEETNLTI